MQTEMAQEQESTKEFTDEEYYSRSLLDYWYPITFSNELKHNCAYSISLFGEPIVLFRSDSGAIVCLEDRCSHRSTPLSIGAVEKGEIECRYHGWRFGEEGKCVRVPSFEDGKQIPDYFRVPSYPAKEKDGMIWVWPGDASKVDDYFPGPPREETADLKVIEQYWDANYSFDLMMENALDPSHLQFVHEDKQGRSVGPRSKTYPDAAGTNAKVEKFPGGFKVHIVSDKTVQPFDAIIAFYYPNYTHMQRPVDPKIFICTWVVPLTRNTSRLIFRFYRSFVTYLPNFLFTGVNDTIVKQDQVVLTGQQIRMEQGSLRWNLPVKSDSLAIAFRRWWDRVVQEQKVWFGNYDSTMKKPSVIRILLKDIEDLGRKDIHPCVPTTIQLQEGYIPKVQKLLPELWPLQYKKPQYKFYAIGVAISAILLYFFIREPSHVDILNTGVL